MTTQRLVVPERCPWCGAKVWIETNLALQPEAALCRSGDDEPAVVCGWRQPLDVDPAATSFTIVTRWHTDDDTTE